MAKLFISYRREDSQDIAGRIFDRLARQFGDEAVFIDVDAIPYGVDFRQYLTTWVASCDILIAVIGKDWLDAVHERGPNAGRRRLEDPTDFVRIEVSAALARHIPVIPLLVGGAAMPLPDQLPPDLADLAFRNAAEVRSGRDFHADISRLISGVERLLKTPPPLPAKPAHATPLPEQDSPALARGVAPTQVDPPAVLWPTNLGFDGPDEGGVPYGWFNSAGYVGGVSTDYEVAVYPRPRVPQGRCVRMHRSGGHTKEFGSLMQRCPAQHLAGKLLRLEAELHAEKLEAWAGLWLRIDGPWGHLFFDNMHDRPIRGTTNWQRYSIETSVSPEAVWINYGILLVANGTLWADNLALTVRDAESETTPNQGRRSLG
jgi:hypothetical protein